MVNELNLLKGVVLAAVVYDDDLKSKIGPTSVSQALQKSAVPIEEGMI